jgi:hypothetical protein
MLTLYGMSDSGNRYKVRPALRAWLERVEQQPGHEPMRYHTG